MKLKSEVIPAILEDVANHEAMKAKLRKDAREGKLLPESLPPNPEDGVSLGFDRAKYQHEYMRRWRAKRKAKE